MPPKCKFLSARFDFFSRGGVIFQEVLIDANNEVVGEGELREEPGTVFYDRHREKGLVAKIHLGEDGDDGEFYLTVDTHDSGTSCTLKVSLGARKCARFNIFSGVMELKMDRNFISYKHINELLSLDGKSKQFQ